MISRRHIFELYVLCSFNKINIGVPCPQIWRPTITLCGGFEETSAREQVPIYSANKWHLWKYRCNIARNIAGINSTCEKFEGAHIHEDEYLHIIESDGTDLHNLILKICPANMHERNKDINTFMEGMFTVFKFYKIILQK